MSTTPDDAATDLLIREVDEDLRHDRMHAVWRQYGSLFFAAAISVVVAVAAWQAWQNWQMRQRLASSDKFVAALSLVDAGRKEDALKQLGTLSLDGTPGYRLLAKLEEAEVLLGTGDVKGTLAVYQLIINDTGVDQIYRDMARLKAAYISLDSGDPAVIDHQVEPLIQDANPWRFEAREIQALNAIKRGETTRAVEVYKALADDSAAPQAIRARAAEMLKILQPKSNG